MFNIAFFPPPSRPSAELQLVAGVTMLGWALLGGAAPPPPLMLVLAVVVVAADIEPTWVLRHMTSVQSLLSSPPPTSLNQPLSNTNLRHIVGLAEVVGMQRRWFCGSGRPQEWILECRRSLLWGLGEELLWSRNSSDFSLYCSQLDVECSRRLKPEPI
ncbi:hypothetical protein C8R43DRAFT_1017684 [Mycena crocata]|nr:hypothetical protein C8R43DRAFT_1017611 [Mycena crocata]KAJ7140167.1 hypothetical protein C8R43DRAFT_1017649 [Mycena crocata]KAJ7140173.1 hypothetical protein C8R43DRAFT_1017684 [Mycena crocata]